MDANRSDEEEGMRIGFEQARYGVSRAELDAMGERAVRDKFNSGDYGHDGVPVFGFVSAWLKDTEFARLAADSAKRDAREAEMLSTAKAASFAASSAAASASEANFIARSNRRIAMAALIIAAIAMVISVFKK